MRSSQIFSSMPLLPTAYCLLIPCLPRIDKRSPGALESFAAFFVYCPDAPSARLRADEAEFIARLLDSFHRRHIGRAVRLRINAIGFAVCRAPAIIDFDG